MKVFYVMKEPQCLLLAFLAVLFSCQTTAPVRFGEAPVKQEVQTAHREGGIVSGNEDTIPQKKDGAPENIPNAWLKPLELPADSIYPRAYSDPWGRESYNKMWKGVYAYSKSYSGEPWDLVISRIDFHDTLGGKINDFDVVGNNPYNKRTVPNLEDENYQEHVYRSFIPKTFTEDQPEYEPSSYYTYTQMPSSQSMPVIGYHLLGAVEGGVTDWKFTAICFDEQGNILRKFENLDIDPYGFCVSENKKFFAVAYGGLRGEELTRLRNNGFRIYEIETGNLVYEMEVDGKHTISGPVADNSYENVPFGSLGSRGNDFADIDNKKYLVIKIDFNNRIIYRRKFLPEEKSKIVGVDAEGFFMRDPITKKRWKLLLEEKEGFEIESF
jgi:hypothetical protein